MRYEDSLELRFNVWLDVWICDACEAQAHVPRRPAQRNRITPICPNPDCIECPAAPTSHWSHEAAERAAAAVEPSTWSEPMLPRDGLEADAELGDRQAGDAAAAATATTRSMLAADPNERASTVHPERAERAGELSRELSRAVDVLEVRCPRCGMPGQTLCTDSELEGAGDG